MNATQLRKTCLKILVVPLSFSETFKKTEFENFKLRPGFHCVLSCRFSQMRQNGSMDTVPLSLLESFLTLGTTLTKFSLRNNLRVWLEVQ